MAKRQDDECLTQRETEILALLREAVESGRPSATWLVVSRDHEATRKDVKHFRRRMLNILRRGLRRQIRIEAKP